MALDKKAIETLSVNAVRSSVVMSEFLDQFIPDNDKEPSWDGFVYIYGDKSKKKSNLKGRMPVQVKGKECSDYSKENISFSMSTADLRNYLYDGGCVLFVVYIGDGGQTSKIYYAELTPIKLRKFLEEAEGQDNKTVYLKEFPYDNNKKATIFLNCLQNCRKQASFTEGALLTLEELEKQGVLENIVIPFSGVGMENPQMALINNEVYLYAQIKGSSIPQPLEIIPQNIRTHQVKKAQITIDDRLFYTEYRIEKSANGITLHFGNSFNIEFFEQEQYSKINYTHSDRIRILEKDLDFFLEYLDKGYFKVNNIKIPFDYDGIGSSNFDIEKEKEHLKYVKDIVKVLNLLGCSEDIDIKDMKDEDWRNLNRLITAFLKKKPVNGLKDDLMPIVGLKVGKLRFVIYLKKCEEKGTYEMYDFFKTDFSVAIEDKNNEGKKLPVSQFIIFHKNDFLTINNMDFDVMLPSFQKIEHHEETFDIANSFLLELLGAYDDAEGLLKDKILKVCKEFSDWILEAPDDEIDYQIKTLNILQTVKRWRDLNIDEIGTLYRMVESKETREDCIIGAYLLLGQQEAAEIHFANLTEEEQKNFKEYPIYHYWEKSK